MHFAGLSELNCSAGDYIKVLKTEEYVGDLA